MCCLYKRPTTISIMPMLLLVKSSNDFPIIEPNFGLVDVFATPGMSELVNMSPFNIVPVTLHGTRPCNVIDAIFAPSNVEFIKYDYADTPNKGENLFRSVHKKIPSSLQ